MRKVVVQQINFSLDGSIRSRRAYYVRLNGTTLGYSVIGGRADNLDYSDLYHQARDVSWFGIRRDNKRL